jgi:anti-anti-sigma regulatory factor
MTGGMTTYSTYSRAATKDDGYAGGSPSKARLAVISTVSGPVCTLSLKGWLDTDSVVALETQFEQLASQQFETIVVDVRELRGLDKVGTAALMYIRDQAEERGAELSIIGRYTGSASAPEAPDPQRAVAWSIA